MAVSPIDWPQCRKAICWAQQEELPSSALSSLSPGRDNSCLRIFSCNVFLYLVQQPWGMLTGALELQSADEEAEAGRGKPCSRSHSTEWQGQVPLQQCCLQWDDTETDSGIRERVKSSAWRHHTRAKTQLGGSRVPRENPVPAGVNAEQPASPSLADGCSAPAKRRRHL